MFESKLFAATFLLLFATMGCKQKNNSSHNDFLNKYPHLRSDSINTFSIGDAFQFTITENSCCQTFFLYAEKPTKELLHEGLFTPVDSSTNIIDSDCAGCSSYFTGIYECTSLGQDTIIHIVIPNSKNFETPHIDSGLQLETKQLQTFTEEIKKYSRKYIVRIN
jgi:hypothetical protein